MLIIKDLHASIDDKKILNGINLSIKPGELHAIMGRNGSGKSTLANIIAGREDYNIESGSILFNGKDLLDQSPEDPCARWYLHVISIPCCYSWS